MERRCSVLTDNVHRFAQVCSGSCDMTHGMISAEMVRRRFRQAVEDAGVTPLHFHGLRHTGATLLLRGGVPLKVVSDILGHANISFTARTYLHVGESMQDEAAQAMGRMLGG
jgi:integrase